MRSPYEYDISLQEWYATPYFLFIERSGSLEAEVIGDPVQPLVRFTDKFLYDALFLLPKL
jgi:hypothetical protein